MSGTEIDELGPETVAAEYVLGTLDGEERALASARRASDPAFAAEIRFWENRLFALTGLAEPVEPPADLWTRIEASTGAKGVRSTAGPANDNRAGFWRATALASMAVAAGLAVFVFVRPVPAPVFAVLSPTGVTAPVLVAFDGPDGIIGLHASGPITVAPDRDLQLWALPAGATRPSSLGLLPPAGKPVPPGVKPGTQLLVSLEPKGGSPTGQPTGPVLYGGTLKTSN